MKINSFLKFQVKILPPVLILSFFIFLFPSNSTAEELLSKVTVSNIKPDFSPMQLESLLVSVIYNNEPATFSYVLNLYKNKLNNSYILENLLSYPEINKNTNFIKSIVSFIENFKSMPNGGQKIIEAAFKTADAGLIKTVINKGACINASSQSERAPIFDYLNKESYETLKILIDNSAEINVLYCGASPLYHAAKNNSTESVLLLLQNGADVNLSSSPIYKPMNAALNDRNLELVKLFIDKKADDDILQSSYDKPLVHYLIKNFSDEIASYCIESGYVKNIDELNYSKQTALLSAIKNNKMKTADALAKRGAQIVTNAAGDRNRENFESLVKTAESGEVDLMHYLTRKENKTLLETVIKNGINPEYMKIYNNNFLFSAIDNRCSEAVELILKNNKDTDWRLNNQTPVEYSFLKGEFQICDMIKSLLKDRPGSVNDYSIKEKNGAINPKLIINTVKSGNIDKIKILIKCGADLNSHEKHESSALHWAVLWGMTDVVKLLVENGAEINERNYYNESSLLLTALNEKKTEIALYLIEKGADLNFADSKSHKILHTAVENNYADIVRSLLKHGYDVNKRDRYQETALFDAIDKNYTECANILIENSAEINICNNDGETPLHIAAKNGNIALAEKLIASGATVNICGVGHLQKPTIEKTYDNSNFVVVSMLIPKRDGPYTKDNMISPLTAAIIAKKPDMVEFLIKKGADVNLLSQNKLAPIHYAINTFQNDLFDSLISKIVDLKIKSTDGYNLLLYAAYYDNLYAVEKLVGLGFKISAVSDDLSSETALHISEKRGGWYVSKYLRKTGASSSKKNYFGKTPDDLKKERHQKAVEALETAINTTDNEYLIKLSYSSGEAFHKICNITCGCDRDPGPSKYTPAFLALSDIQKAVWLNMFDAVESYICGESDGAKKNALGQSIFDLAIKLKRKKMVDYLLSDEFNFDISPDSLFIIKNNGWSDLFEAAIARGIKIDAIDKGKSFFYYADYKTFIKLAKTFKNYKFNNEMASGLIQRILSSTAEFNTDECIRIINILSERGYDFNIRAQEDPLPVFSAVKHRVFYNTTDGVEIIKALIRNGADVNLKEKFNEEIMDGAARKLNAGLIDLLSKHGADVKSSMAISTALRSYIDGLKYSRELSEAEAMARFDALIETIEALKAGGLDVFEKNAAKNYGLPIEIVFRWQASKDHGPLAKEKAVEYKNILINLLAGDVK